jgi:methyl-accepting chemotaxis protein
LSEATFDSAYEEKVLTVGRTHARIGLEPRWYIGGYAIIADRLIKAIVEDRESTLFKRLKNDPAALGANLSTLVKAMLLDMDLAITAYLETTEAERLKAEAARAEAIENQRQALEALTAALGDLSQGNLITRLDKALPQEFQQMQTDFNGTVGKLQEVITSAVISMRSIESGNRELAQATDDLARRTEQQAASLEETTAALAQITDNAHLSRPRISSL